MKKARTTNLILTAAVGIGAIVSLLLLRKKAPLKSSSKSKSGSKGLEKAKCIAILKELKRELFPLLNEIMMDSRRIHEEIGEKISVDEIKDILLHHDKNFKQDIKEINSKVLGKHGAEESEFECACETLYKDDLEVKELIAEMRNNLEKALKGEYLDLKANIPEFLTPEFTLKLMAKVMKNNLKKMKEIFDKLKEEGEQISLGNKKVLEALKDLKVDSMRIEILKEAGLNEFDEPPSKIFQYAIQKYSLTNPSGFLSNLEQLERQHQKAMESLLKDNEFRERYIEEVGVHLGENIPMNKGTSAQEGHILAKNFDPLSRSEINTGFGKDLTNSSPPDIGKRFTKQVSVEFQKHLTGKKELMEDQGLVNSAIETFFQVISGLDHSSILSGEEEHKVNEDSDGEIFKSAIQKSSDVIEPIHTHNEQDNVHNLGEEHDHVHKHDHNNQAHGHHQ